MSAGELVEVEPCSTCDCGCEPDGSWHYEERFCVCVALHCPCVVDSPGVSVP